MYVAMSFYGKKTYATPKRKTLASERVGLHPRKENCATEECYRRGMRLTAINPNPVNYNSDSDNSSNGDGNLDGDYSFDTRRPTQPEHDRPSFQSPHFQQRTQSPFSTPSPASQKNWISMLQQQQAILHELLEGQKRLEKRQDCFEDQLADLASKVEQPIPTTPSSSSSEGKRKRMVTRTLSNKVYAIHKELENQFKPSEMWSSDDNKIVQQHILKEILSQVDCKFSESEIKVAIKRCYENIRRTFLEQQSGKEDFVEQQSKRRKYRSRRERKFQRRTSAVTKGEMEKYWHKLSLAYVTEESDDPDNPNGIIEHKLPWRSQKLNDFMVVLDNRLAKNQKCHLAIGMVAKKVRKDGAPSDSLPPPDAPSWAVMDPHSAKDADKENDHEQELFVE